MFTTQATIERRAAKEARLNAIETQIASHAMLGKQLEEVKSTIKATEDRISSLVSKVEDVERSVTVEIDDKVFSVSSEVSSVKDLVLDMSGHLLHCKKNAVQMQILTAKFDELLKAVDSLRQEIKDMQKQQPVKQAKAAASSFVLPPKKPSVSEDATH